MHRTPCNTDERNPWFWCMLQDMSLGPLRLLPNRLNFLRVSWSGWWADPNLTCFHSVQVEQKRVWSKRRILSLGLPGCMSGTLGSKLPFCSVFNRLFNTEPMCMRVTPDSRQCVFIYIYTRHKTIYGVGEAGTSYSNIRRAK